MIKDFKLTVSSIGFLIKQIWELGLTNKAYRVSISLWRENRSLSQNAFQHVIYSELSKYLTSKGRTDWTKEKTKFEMKNNFLGWVEVECTNINTGERRIKEVLKKTSDLDTGESYHYTTQLLDFAQSIGCTIRIPENSEYFSLQSKQNS